MDGHPDWTIDLTSGETRVGSDQEPQAPAPEPETPPTPENPTLAAQGLPDYRVRAILEREERVRQENEYLRQTMQELMARVPKPGAPQAPQPPAEDLDDDTEAIRAEFFRRFPQFREIADKWPAIQQMLERVAPAADQIPRFVQDQERRWMQVADYYLDAVVKTASQAFRGGAPIPQGSPQALQIQRAFHDWVSAQPGLVSRYEMGDAALVQEFVNHFRDQTVAYWQPPAAQAAPTRPQARVAKLPMQGSSGVPAPAGPPRPNLNNEDEVHAAAWQFMRSQMAAEGR